MENKLNINLENFYFKSQYKCSFNFLLKKNDC